MTEPANLSRLYANVQMHAPGVLNPSGIQPELFETFRDFCQHTNAWSQTQDIVVSGASQTYPLTCPIGSAMKRVLSMRDITQGLNTPFLPVRWPITFQLPATLVIGASLQNTYTWRVQTSLYPVDPVDGNGDPMVPQWLADDFQDTLLSGTLFRLMAQTAKPYSNAQLAGTRYKLYLKGRGEAAAAILHANMYEGQAWMFPQAGLVRGRQRGV